MFFKNRCRFFMRGTRKARGIEAAARKAKLYQADALRLRAATIPLAKNALSINNF
jgi:hypothetical protein